MYAGFFFQFLRNDRTVEFRTDIKDKKVFLFSTDYLSFLKHTFIICEIDLF